MVDYDDDDQLADAVKNGDVAALDAFFNRFQVTLIKFAISQRFSPEDAEDLAQEALKTGFLRIASFRRGEDLKGWLNGMLNNMMLREWERRKQMRVVELDESAEEKGSLRRVQESTAEEKLGAEERKELGRLRALIQLYMTLARTNPKHVRYMDAVQLELDGLEREQIEDALGLTKQGERKGVRLARAQDTQRDA